MATLNGNIILVAGGAGAVGEGITRQFISAGATVVVPSRSLEKGDQLRDLVGNPPAEQLVTLTGSIGDESGADELRRQIVDRYGRLDHAVASLGGWWQGKPLIKIDLERWQQVLHNNLTTHFIMARAFVPLLAPPGSYTLISGDAGINPVPNAGPVSTAAAALIMLGKVLAAENGPGGVRVNNLVLGTPIITRARPNGKPEWLTADEVGRYCVALASGSEGGQTILFENAGQLSKKS